MQLAKPYSLLDQVVGAIVFFSIPVLILVNVGLYLVNQVMA